MASVAVDKRLDNHRLMGIRMIPSRQNDDWMA